ncbi:MAG: DUF1902 domain-containing protein [Azospirillaceae bacterium]|nr:DUF1902 domain-containing protein [Azospirillaceae bacterium]
MADHVYTVQVAWDEESRTYYVAETDIPGLHSEADTFEALIERVTAVVPGSCPRSWCKKRPVILVSGAFGRDDHAATVGSMMVGSSPTAAMVSRVM